MYQVKICSNAFKGPRHLQADLPDENRLGRQLLVSSGCVCQCDKCLFSWLRDRITSIEEILDEVCSRSGRHFCKTKSRELNSSS